MLAGLPAGKYLANAHVVAGKRGQPTLIRCRLTNGARNGMAASIAVGEIGASFLGSLTASWWGSSEEPFDLRLLCMKAYTNEPEKSTYLETIQIQAIKVGALN